LSIVGAGIGSEHKILTEIFKEFSKIGTHIEADTTSELSINIFLKKKFLDKSISALLDKFQLRK
jgi:aspartokinase